MVRHQAEERFTESVQEDSHMYGHCSECLPRALPSANASIEIRESVQRGRPRSLLANTFSIIKSESEPNREATAACVRVAIHVVVIPRARSHLSWQD